MIDGDATVMVRPYVLAHEQAERRTALALALDGVDVGPWISTAYEWGALDDQ